MHGVNEGRVKLWIEALRSGEFQQSYGWMEETTEDGDGNTEVVGYCCLGVATKVALRNGCPEPDGLEWGQTSMHTDIGAWFGFAPWGRNDPTLGYLGHGEYFTSEQEDGATEEVACTRANDELGWDFDTISNRLQDRYITPETSKESQVSG